MSNTTIIEYEDTDGAGTVTLMANPFSRSNGGKKYSARFDRVTVNIDNLIARIQKKEVGTNGILAKQFASLFKAEILEALSRGEAVNFLDLGTFYIAASAEGDNPATVNIGGFQVKFTASKVMNEAVSSLKVKKIVLSNTTPVISSMTDLYIGEKGEKFTAGKSVRIEGSKLKIAGEDGGVFFAPTSEDGEINADESSWIKVASLIRNSAKILEFFLPNEVQAGKRYFVMLKTTTSSESTKTKTYSVASSAIVSIVA